MEEEWHTGGSRDVESGLVGKKVPGLVKNPSVSEEAGGVVGIGVNDRSI